MDIRLFNACVNGYNKRRELAINDSLQAGHIVAGKTAAAVWGNRSFKQPIKPVKLAKEDADDAEETLIRKKIAFWKSKGII